MISLPDLVHRINQEDRAARPLLFASIQSRRYCDVTSSYPLITTTEVIAAHRPRNKSGVRADSITPSSPENESYKSALGVLLEPCEENAFGTNKTVETIPEYFHAIFQNFRVFY